MRNEYVQQCVYIYIYNLINNFYDLDLLILQYMECTKSQEMMLVPSDLKCKIYFRRNVTISQYLLFSCLKTKLPVQYLPGGLSLLSFGYGVDKVLLMLVLYSIFLCHVVFPIIFLKLILLQFRKFFWSAPYLFSRILSPWSAPIDC